MGSGDWLKNIISKKKAKGDGSKKIKRYSTPGNINSFRGEPSLKNDSLELGNGSSVYNQSGRGSFIDSAAATKIQTAYRAYMARKTLRRMRGMARLHNLVQCDSVKKQASITSSLLLSWSKTQSQIRSRRVHMVNEGQLRQKKLQNQLKLEAKLHGLKVEWSGGSETIDAALAKIHQREEAAVRRERAMAYAFSYQWRANSSPSLGSSKEEVSKANWGWSWKDRWIAARPWESRVVKQGIPKKIKTHQHQPNKNAQNLISPSAKPPRKTPAKAIKLSYKASGRKAARKVDPKAEKAITTNEKDLILPPV